MIICSYIEKKFENSKDMGENMEKDYTNKQFWDRFSKIYHPFMKRNAAAYDSICQCLEKYIDHQKRY